MRLQPRTGPERILIVGDSGETSLVAALSRAADLVDESLPLEGETLWVRTYSAAVRVSLQIPVSIVIVDIAALNGQVPQIVDCRGTVVPVRPVSDELERRLGRVYPSLAETPDQFASEVPVASPLAAGIRRTLEVCLALVVLLVMLPCILILGALYRLVFGPTDFLRAKEIVSKDGRTVRVQEFLPRARNLEENSRKARVAQSIERNIFRIHLNGVPALWAVVTGDLALVGPTPMSKGTFDMVVAEHPVFVARTLVRAGLISLARVRLRTVCSDYDLKRAIEYDLYYVKHRSLWLDTRILGRASIILVSDICYALVRIASTAISLAYRSVQNQMRGAQPRAADLVTPPMPVVAGAARTNLSPTLIIGAGAGATLLLRELQRNSAIGLWPVAVVDDAPHLIGTKIQGVPVLGPTAAARTIVERERIRSVVIAVPSASKTQMQRLVRIAQGTGASVYTMPGVGQILKGTAPSALLAVPVSDLLGRPVVSIDTPRARQFLGGKRVLVTGAVGSIGREVVLQALQGEPATIFGMDINESDLYDLQQESKQQGWESEFVPIVGSVCDRNQVDRILHATRPQVVFHAAAYKHVPLMEDYPHEAVRTNVGGTNVMARASAQWGVERFVMVSTDKAVNPTSVMGATKRIAELIVQEVGLTTDLSTCSVRFGNVLGSRGVSFRSSSGKSPTVVLSLLPIPGCFDIS